MRKKSNGKVALIGVNRTPVKVCDVVNGKPKVKQRIKEDSVEFVLRYSIFHKEVKKYNKNTFEEIK